MRSGAARAYTMAVILLLATALAAALPVAAQTAARSAAALPAFSMPLAAGAAARRGVAVLDLCPAQMAVGERQVDEKAAKLRAMGAEERTEYFRQKKHVVDALRAPDGRLFIDGDHHHLLRAAWKAGVERVNVSIADLSHLEDAEFWKVMLGERAARKGERPQRRVRLIDEFGQGVERSDLPGDVRGLRNDPHRSVAGEVRKAGGFEKTGVRFEEFAWADLFRERLKSDPAKNYEKAVAEAMEIAASPDGRRLQKRLKREARRRGL